MMSTIPDMHLSGKYNAKTATRLNVAAMTEIEPETAIIHLWFASEGSAVNKVDDISIPAMSEALAWCKAQADAGKAKGVILRSDKRDFCVGANLNMLYAEHDKLTMYNAVRELQKLFRQPEQLGIPIVCVILGSAIGGGCEFALGCNHRIALDDARIKMGLPEVSLGMLPGAGGTQRLPRMIGLQNAMEIILQAQVLRIQKAHKKGLVDMLVDSPEAAIDAARNWLIANPNKKQPWDEKGFRMPPPRTGGSTARDLIMAAGAMLHKKTAGAYRAPELALSSIAEGTQLNFDRAMEVECRYFTALACSQQAKDMIRTFWFHKSAADKCIDLPTTRSLGMADKIADGHGIKRVAILGAGMMGASLAYVCANCGFEVVLKDIKQEVLTSAKAHVDGLIKKRSKHLSADEQAKIASRIRYTIEQSDLSDCDLVIEAVFEDMNLKHRVFNETVSALSAGDAKTGGIWASNTSALPISDLAQPAKAHEQGHSDRFVGLHFFSPVEKMPLVEIIRGKDTSDETIARCLAFVRTLKKTPIVVGDGYGFYTTRVFSAYILEGAQLVAEGVSPALIETAARQAGMVVGPLQVFDEISLKLGTHAIEAAKSYGRTDWDIDGTALVAKLVKDHDRGGRGAGAGFYEYEGPGGKRIGLWSGLADIAGTSRSDGNMSAEAVQERLLLVQAVDAVRAIEAGVITRYRDAEVGAVFGIGFAPNRGGPLAYLDAMGLATAIDKLATLESTHGARFAVPSLLKEMATTGKRFFDLAL